MDKPTGRVIALIVLLILVAAALRGYLPASERSPHKEPTEHPAALVFIVVLLSVSLAIVALSVIARLRDRRPVAASIGALSETPGGRGGRPSWRVLLIGLGVLLVWLLIVLLLTRLLAQHGMTQPMPAAPTSTPTPESTTATPPPPQGRQNTDVFRYLAASTVTLLLLLVASAVIAARKQRRIPRSEIITDYLAESPAPASGSETLVRAAEQGLAEIGNLSREPREAIIACYAAMERELSHVPDAVPQVFDTPTEVLARAVEHHALHADNAAKLVNLFEEARFSPHVMNERHRETAVHALRLVLAELRSIA